MANPTTNYSFVLPTSADLVTDLPADFDIALQGVDTRLKALQPGTTAGDLAYSSATANTNVRLGIGTTGQVLAVVAGVPAWATTADQTPLTTKGDLFSFSTVDARLAVGANGETLVANSFTATGLSYAENYAAGKNKIINGDFNVNQRAFTSRTADGYGFDRWDFALSGATATYSAETFTPGAAPVAGYESKNFARLNVTVGNDSLRIQQLIEDVRTFAGQTVTVSFYAKGTNPTTAGNLAVNFVQNFGTGGSPSSQVTTTQQTFVLTASFVRYSLTFAIPSISGKTIGTDANSSNLRLFIGQGSSISTDAFTLDLWGVQVEAGSVATAFQTATGTIQGELAACQRYYYRETATSSAFTWLGNAGFASTTTNVFIPFRPPVTMRIAPSSLDFSNLSAADGVTNLSVSSASIDTNHTASTLAVNLTVQGAAQFRPYIIRANNSASAFIGFSAEL